MRYRVIHAFNDLADKKHLYKVGDEYPRAGIRPSEQRIEILMGSDNRLHTPLIEDTETAVKQTEVVVNAKTRQRRNKQ